MEFSRKEYWSRLPFPSPEDLPDPEIAPGSPALRADALNSEPQLSMDVEVLKISWFFLLSIALAEMYSSLSQYSKYPPEVAWTIVLSIIFKMLLIVPARLTGLGKLAGLVGP